LFINHRTREMNIKVVYYGPALAGKTTNLQVIHDNARADLRSDLLSIKTCEDRTLFFDYMQLEIGAIRGLKPKFSLYTVPGQVRYEASRKLVLQGADGVVFVADSQSRRLPDNLVSLAGLSSHLRELGQQLQGFPIVLQFNKQDLGDALDPALLRARLVQNGIPCFSAIATRGSGVFETLKAIIGLIVRRLNSAPGA